MKRATIHLIAAARPNFMKIAPLYHAMTRDDRMAPVLVHTGQHYDADMSDKFFKDLRLPPPDFHLRVGSGSHAEQTGGVMIAYERLCGEHRPDWAVVAGDVNSTVACSLAAVKLLIPVAHLEAGLRSFDRTMPEEINRVVTDSIADLLWTPSEDGDQNLLREGVPPERIERIGNIMIDSFELMRDSIERSRTREGFGLEPGGYAVATLHRPSNVDRKADLEELVEALIVVSAQLPLVFPLHPRTRNRLREFGLYHRLEQCDPIRLTAPMGYIEFMGLVRESGLVITDSGGLQEETTYLDLPCLTLRDTTERPITLSQGTNRLVTREGLAGAVGDVLDGRWPRGRCPDLWDGHSAERAVESLARRLR